MVELIITEKPNAAQRIAEALADGKPIKESKNGVPYYKITHGKHDIVVACAVGHLYGLAQKEGKRTFPVFDIEWRPAGESKKADFSKKYLEVIKSLAKQADEFTVATDFDIEGEVIGLNIVRYACKKKDANRMKFSTLTKEDIVEAYENKSKTLAWGQAKAGETRHFLDWYNGINYSRALTSAIKSAGAFKIMSTGRVQGPSLKIIVGREREIKAFKPTPFWQIQLLGRIKEDIEAWHQEDKFWEKEKALKVMSNVKGQKQGKISSTDTKSFDAAPPTPFDLTTLQLEAYRTLKISPKDTLSVAQDLYTSGLISYPRTSSQQLPDKIGFKKILAMLSSQDDYAKLCKNLLQKPLKPNNGKKTDPAHPAIYPTGIQPRNLEGRHARLYDLIVRRFLATFAEKAVRETNTIIIDVNKEPFVARGIRTTTKGWHEYYGPYVMLEEKELPKVKANDVVEVKKISMLDKETQPPKRYTEASIIKELEKRNLGTKSTRAQIVDTLYQRGYIDGKSITATDLGIRTIEALEKHAPKIIDEELTRHFEEDMEMIQENKKKPEEVLNEAKGALTEIIKDFKAKEKEIGKELLEAHKETRAALTTLGLCPVCKQKDLQIRRGKFGFFAACSGYPECKTTFSLPSNALIKPAKSICETCGFPMVTAIKKAKKPQDFCLNPNCPSKLIGGEAGKTAKAVAKGEIEKACPKCKEGKLVLRSSIYGKFYGCSKYPKCRYTEKLEQTLKG
ncbi:MAG TPA: DNA topoisomerase I [Candidatus Nanoarchaeia archaeon]|nr:DNA topoisomerase I [Candidatus Nanoarchaeia archaeon]